MGMLKGSRISPDAGSSAVDIYWTDSIAILGPKDTALLQVLFSYHNHPLYVVMALTCARPILRARGAGELP